MAKTLSATLGEPSPRAFRTGHQLIEIVTSGMYSNPMMIYREYIQNAVDSIDDAVAKGYIREDEGLIAIEIDGLDRRITILDNGAGINESHAGEVLSSLGVSTKTVGEKRGFRGIGRLGGIGYSEGVQFESRSIGSEWVDVATWDCDRLRKGIQSAKKDDDIRSLLRASVKIGKRRAEDSERIHFFRVTMFDVHRFHRDELMNLQYIGSYLSQVAPVPFNSDLFPFAEKVNHHLSQSDGFRTYRITLNDSRVLRPHQCVFEASQKVKDTIVGVELFNVKGREGSQIGYGWYAKTSYLSSLPARIAMRGIRVRQGNIEVGDEYFLESSFSERRFATWHIGEINLNYSVKVNARRDGFEQSLDYEAFLEHASALGRYLSRLCRASSEERSCLFTAERMLAQLECLLAQDFVIDEHHLESTKASAMNILEKLSKMDRKGSGFQGFDERLNKARRRFSKFEDNTPLLKDVLDGRSLRYIGPKDLVRNLASAIVQNNHTSVSPEKLIINILRPFLRPSSLGKLGNKQNR